MYYISWQIEYIRCSRLSSSVWRPVRVMASLYEVYVLSKIIRQALRFKLLSLMDINTVMPHRTGILNNRAHVSNIHRHQIPTGTPKRFKRLSMYSLWLLFDTMFLTCESQQRSDCTVRPRKQKLGLIHHPSAFYQQCEDQVGREVAF